MLGARVQRRFLRDERLRLRGLPHGALDRFTCATDRAPPSDVVGDVQRGYRERAEDEREQRRLKVESRHDLPIAAASTLLTARKRWRNRTRDVLLGARVGRGRPVVGQA